MAQRITIVKVRRGNTPNINQELQWLGNSLGLFGLRDRDSSCFRIFIAMVRTSRQNKPLSSDDIAEKLDLSRGTVVHHLTRLMDSGIVVREKKGYFLRESSLHRLIDDMRKDIDSVFEELETVAKDIDEKIG